MPIAEQIRDEFYRLRREGLIPSRLRITHDALATLRRDAGENDSYFHPGLARSGHFMGLNIIQEPVGSIDDPCWQIMTAKEGD